MMMTIVILLIQNSSYYLFLLLFIKLLERQVQLQLSLFVITTLHYEVNTNPQSGKKTLHHSASSTVME